MSSIKFNLYEPVHVRGYTGYITEVSIRNPVEPNRTLDMTIRDMSPFQNEIYLKEVTPDEIYSCV